MSGLLFGRVFKTRIPDCTIDAKAKSKKGGKAKHRTIRGATQKLVLLHFADKANDTGEGIYPSRKTISEETELSESVVSFATEALVIQGFIKKLGLSKYGTTDYAMNIDNLAEIIRKGSLSSVRTPPVLSEDTHLSSVRTPPVLSEDYNPQLNPPFNPPSTPVVVVGEWGSDFFQKINLSKSKQKELSVRQPQEFIAAYLYLATQARIENPLGLAIKTTIERGERGMGEPYQTLAGLGPRGLAEVLGWLRDGCAYSLNGAMAPALAYRGLLPEKKSHVVIATRALNELGLETLAPVTDRLSTNPDDYERAPRPVLDAWQIALEENLVSNKDLREKFLVSSHLIRHEGNKYIVGVDKHFRQWLSTGRVPQELRGLNIEWIAE